MEPEIQTQTPTFDPIRIFEIARNPDGTITHLDPFPKTPASTNPGDASAALVKDVEINPNHGTWARLYLPPQVQHPTKLPLVVYFHGGGFVCFSASTTLNHGFCSLMATSLPALVVSVGYRLAPEHRLPAAYDDAMEALRWVKTNEDEWLDQFADFSNCCLMGTSSGGNIAYHAALRICKDELTITDLQPLNIKGMILHYPFFGGSNRTESEIRMFDDMILPVRGTELLWELSLPVGTDRDHEYCNPKSVDKSSEWERMKSLKWKVMVTGGDGDPLVDRQREFATLLEEKGLHVVGYFSEDIHAVELVDMDKARTLFEKIKNFMM